MDDDSAVNSADKSEKKPRGKPFTGADDPRRHKTGRPRVPKSAIELQKLIDEIAAEEVENPNTGERIQRIRAMLRSMMTGKDTSGKVHILDRRYGKVVEKHDVTTNGKDITKVIIEYIDDSVAPLTPSAEANQDDPQEV